MLASRAALAWARVYTSGMPEHVRRARIDELSSDLWEHHAHAVAAGRRRVGIQLEIGARIARGAGADLAWRATNRSGLTAALFRAAGWAGFALAAALLLCFTATSGAPVIGLYTVEDWEPGEAREFARATAAIFVGLVAGFALLRTRPLAATALVAGAGGSLALYVACLWPVFVPCAGACTAGAGVIARRRRRDRRALAPPQAPSEA
jgi:hypothetical protein